MINTDRARHGQQVDAGGEPCSTQVRNAKTAGTARRAIEP
jgi:hypothetical protein